MSSWTEADMVVPESFKVKLKRVENMIKEVVSIDPSTSLENIRPGSRIIVHLPSNSLIDLSTFSMFFDAETTAGGRADTGAANTAQRRLFPRNTASFVQNFCVKINGGIKINIDEYNMLYNVLSDLTQGGDALKRRQVGGENTNPSAKVYNLTNGDTTVSRGFCLGNTDAAYYNQLRDKQRYCIRSWLSFFGGNASTNVIDTIHTGIITVEIVLAPASMLMLSTEATAGAVAAAAATPYYAEVGLAAPAPRAAAGVLAEDPINYRLDNLTFRIMRYHAHPSFYDAQANNLKNGKVLPIYFPNYTVFPQTGVKAKNKSGVFRTGISTNSLDAVIGLFRMPAYDTPRAPLNTLISPKISLDIGSSNATSDNLISAGLPLAFNQSVYFAANGDSIKTAKWKIGSTPFEEQDIDEQYYSLLNHFNIHQDTQSGIHPCINSLYAYKTHSYAHVCSLNMSDPDAGAYVISGKNSEQSTISIEWQVKGETMTVNNGTINVAAAVDQQCIPYIICCHNSSIQISAGRIVEFIN